MSRVTFSGPIRSGTNRSFNQYYNCGKPLLMQNWKYDIPNLAVSLQSAQDYQDYPTSGSFPSWMTTALTLAAGTFNAPVMHIPVGSIITNIYADIDVVWNQGTSAVATIGTAAGGTQYVTSIDLKSATGRIPTTFSAAQLLAMNNAVQDTSLNTQAYLQLGVQPTASLYLQIISVGTNASTGHGFIYVQYQQDA